MRSLDPDSHKPLNLQIADAILGAVRAGEFPRGAKIPSHAELQVHFAAARGTVDRALQLLKLANILFSRQGSGVYVRHSLPELPASVADLLGPAIATVTPGTQEDVAARLDRMEGQLARIEQALGVKVSQ